MNEAFAGYQMHTGIRIKCNQFVYIYMIIYLLFSGLIEYRILWHVAILGVSIILLVAYPKTRSRAFRGAIIPGLILTTVILIFLSLMIGENNDISNVLSNIRSMAYSVFALITLLMIMEKDKYAVFKSFDKHIAFFNAVLIINTIVLAIQARGTGFLIKSSWLAQNPYYDDHVAGLFGMNSTNHIGMYSVFVMLLNFSYARRNLGKGFRRKKILIVAYTLVMQVIMAGLSRYNDNAGYFVVLAMFLGLYLVFDLTKLTKSDFKRFLKAATYVLVAIIGVIIFINLPPVKKVLDVFLRNRIEAMLHFKTMGMTGSNERIYQIVYGLSNSFGWILGKGFGSAQMVQANAHGFYHFGLASAGAYIILSGVWFYLAYSLLYSMLLYRILTNGKRRSGMVFIVVFVIMLLFTVYLPIFNDARSVVLLGLYAILFNYLWTSKNSEMGLKSESIY